MDIFSRNKRGLVVLILCILLLLFFSPSLAATTRIHIVKYASDGTTILGEKNLTYQEMRDTLPVQGDGSTHYYHQGPVFADDPDEAVEQHSVGIPGKIPMSWIRTWAPLWELV